MQQFVVPRRRPAGNMKLEAKATGVAVHGSGEFRPDDSAKPGWRSGEGSLPKK